MRRVEVGQPIRMGAGGDQAWRRWVEASINELQEASHVPDTRPSQLTATALFIAFCASETFA